jgi:HSP20 family protein
MQMVRFDPFGMLREFDRMLEADTAAEPRSWAPRIDAFDRDGSLVIRVEVPGVNVEDIDITVENGKLEISGSRSLVSETNEGGFHRKEILEGSFKRSLFLPDSADIEQVSATSKDGILEIVIPTRVEALPKKVTVEVS